MRVGFDIGGTFTDVIVIDDDGRLTTAKVLSLLDRVGEDIARTVRETDPAAKVEGFVHGTTIASNAVIEGTVAATGLLATRGFRDELEMRGQRRPNIYDNTWERLPPLVPRHLRREIDERILGDGEVERPIDLDAARSEIERLLDADVEAITVALVNAYLNPAHEAVLGDLIAEMAPEMVVCLSSEIHPEIREYERTSTTVINASLIPIVRRYLDRLEGHLATFSERLLIMQSNGGIMSAAAARRRPAYMIESGPAAGVLAAAKFADAHGFAKVLSFDMGGTTAKACLIEDGTPLEKPGGEVGGGATMTTQLFGGGGHALRVPWLDIAEVGAGGGSIAWIDDGGALRVGPVSAGAEPGPVCYGRGGDRPTVTDAHVVLGYMNPGAIADATLSIDRGAAWAAIEAEIATPLGLEVLPAAHGIVQVANATMMRALRAVSTERGRDPREFALIPFGGAGPIHAAALADSLAIGTVHVPIYPGLFSALGLLLADYRHDYIRSIARPLDSLEAEEIRRGFEELEARAVRELAGEGIDQADMRIDFQVDLKYGYQVSEITLPFRDFGTEDPKPVLAAAFTEVHRQSYGYVSDDPVELVNLRLRATASADRLDFAALYGIASEQGGAGTREVYFGPEIGTQTARILTRADLPTPTPGPLVIEEPDTTVVVPPGWSAVRAPEGYITIERDTE